MFHRNNKRRDDISMDDYDVAEGISNRPTNHPEKETLISSQLEVEYPKQSNYDDGRADEEKELYDKPRIYKPIQNESIENQVTNNNQSSDISRDDSIESSSKVSLIFITYYLVMSNNRSKSGILCVIRSKIEK